MRTIEGSLLLALLLCAAPAAAKRPGAVLRHQPAPGSADERPVATRVAVRSGPSGFTLELTFDAAPFGDTCRSRCANTTVYLDTDNSKATGLQVGDKGAATGADLAITVQGVRDWGEAGSKDSLRVRIRHLGGQPKSLEEGDVVAELDHARDAEVISIKDNTVTVKVDPNAVDLPAGRTVRAIYQPPGSKALTGTLPGLLVPARGGSRNVDIVRGGQR